MTTRRSTSFARRAAIALATVLAAAGVAAPAQAAPYVIAQCGTINAAGTDVAGPVGVAQDWFSTPNTVGTTDACGSKQGYVLTVKDNTLSPWGSEWSYTGARFTLTAATPNLLIKSVDTILSVSSKTGDSALSYGSLMTNGTSGNWGVENIPAGTWEGWHKKRWAQANAQGTRSLDVVMSCYAPCVFNGPAMVFHAIQLVLDDPVVPDAATLEKRGLLDGSAQRGTRTVALATSDGDSGVRRIQIRTESGALVASLDTPGCSFDRPSPCAKARPQDTLSVDTTKLPEGEQVLEAWIYDAAENRRVTALPKILVDNVPDGPAPPRPLVPNNGTGGSPATGQLLPSRKAKRVRVGFGKSPTLRGRLVDDAGKPIAEASLDVYERVLAPGAPRVKTATLTTDGAGEYKLKPGAGSSRLVEVQFSRERGATEYQTTHAVTVEVKPKVTLRLARGRISGGGKATLRGRVKFDGVRAGAIVELQASDRGRWLTTGVVRTDDEGRFSWSHRFKIRHGRITFRAVLKTPSDQPAVSNRSGKVTLRIG